MIRQLFTGILICICFAASSQDSIVLLRHTDFAKDQLIHLDIAPWSFSKTKTAQPPSFNLADWILLPGTDFSPVKPPPGWDGIGWFLLKIKTDSVLADKKLCLQINHDGASEIWMDGKQIGGYGTVNENADKMVAKRAPKALIPVWFNDTLLHLIALRYANFKPVYADFPGFQLAVGEYDTIAERINTSNRRMLFLLMTVGAYFILGFLFLSLFVFYPAQKLYLYFGAFVLLLGVTVVSIYFYYQATVPLTQFWAEMGTYLCKILMLWAGSLLLYAVGHTKMPRRRIIIVSAITFTYIVTHFILVLAYDIFDWEDRFSWVFFLFTLDGSVSVYHAVKRKLPNVWLIATGMAAISLLYFFAWGDTFMFWPREANSLRLLVIAVGNLIFPACFSLYLALDFARTSHQLTLKLKEVENLYSQNLRQETEKLELVSGQAKKLEREVAERTAEIRLQADRLKALDVVKSRFFTNLTHEFKTPLTLIISPAKELMQTTHSAFVQHNARLIRQNAEQLRSLINQMLDLSKLEEGKMELVNEPIDLVHAIYEWINLQSPLASQKKLTLSLHSAWQALTVVIDKEKLQKVFHNILSNAIKFTNSGTVTVSLHPLPETSSQGFEITVLDTGRGISENKLPHIFERFYQADAQDNRLFEGSGIGLALAKELVTIMGGTIVARSKEQEYSLFTIQFSCPFLNTVPGPYELNFNEEALSSMRFTDLKPILNLNNNGGNGNQSYTEPDTDSPQILVIEDNKGLRNFLSNILSTHYKVTTAADGKAGIVAAQEQIPDLVITDIMMPDADGYQVCQTLKTDERTSHIPIVFLTAKSGTDNRILGIETGADAYLEKPFDQQELIAVVDNLISIRNLLQQKFQRSAASFSHDKTLPSIEQEFMNRVRQAIHDNLDDPQFGADQLSVQLSLSRSQLHRKLKGLLDRSAGELIRTTRLEHAHQLLKNKSGTVAEIGYMVGFSSPSTFTTAFSRHFGYPPSEINRHTDVV